MDHTNTTIADVPSPLGYISRVRFPWLFAVWAVVLGLWILFYTSSAHRWLASALAFLVNRLLLRDGAELRISSIYFALLGGRVCFEGVRLTAPDYAFEVEEGAAVIRWWAPARQLRDGYHNPGRRPPRLRIELQGARYAMFGNVAAHDALVRLKRDLSGGGLQEDESMEPTSTAAAAPAAKTGGGRELLRALLERLQALATTRGGPSPKAPGTASAAVDAGGVASRDEQGAAAFGVSVGASGAPGAGELPASDQVAAGAGGPDAEPTSAPAFPPMLSTPPLLADASCAAPAPDPSDIPLLRSAIPKEARSFLQLVFPVVEIDIVAGSIALGAAVVPTMAVLSFAQVRRVRGSVVTGVFLRTATPSPPKAGTRPSRLDACS